MNDPIWSERGRPVLDLRQTALIETNDKEGLKGYLSSTPVGPSESVAVIKHEPQRVELRASLDRPGLVILADTYYPGWRLTIDGMPAPIFRANRMMRGAAMPAGEHTLVYTYEPGVVPNRCDRLPGGCDRAIDHRLGEVLEFHANLPRRRLCETRRG